MDIKPIKRPWMRASSQGARYNPDPFYHSSEWKRIREDFLSGTTTLPDGMTVSNKYCLECWVEDRKLEPTHAVDHIVRIKAGGDRRDKKNMQGLCKRHHAIKSANEANERHREGV